MKFLKKLFFIVAALFVFQLSNAQATGGYATMRVFDCNKAVGMGTGYIAAKIFIVYESGETETENLLPFSDKNEFENLKKINQVINKLKTKGYFLISQYTTGEQGNLISDYTFLKQQ